MEHHKISHIISNLIIVLLGMIAIFAIWGFIQIGVLHQEYVNIFGYSIFRAETGSMSPILEIGDIVVVKLGEQPLKEKDIITYKSENALITHRIVNIDGDSIIAKGDNNNAKDDPIQKNQIVGKVIFAVNNVEIWKKVFKDINVIIPVSITVILLILVVAYKEKASDAQVQNANDEKKTAEKEKTGDENV